MHDPLPFWSKLCTFLRCENGWVISSVAHFVFTERWKHQYAWESASPLNISPHGDDPKLVNGAFLQHLSRSSAFKFLDQEQRRGHHRIVQVEGHLMVVMPRTVDFQLLSQDDAELGVKSLLGAGSDLEAALFASDILRNYSEDEARAAVQCVAAERNNPVNKRAHTQQTDKGLLATGLRKEESADPCAQESYVVELKRYNDFFTRTVYVMRERRDGVDHGWPRFRCTCLPFSVHAGCEHVVVARNWAIQGLRDTPTNSDILPAQSKRGRRCGSYTTA